MSLSRWNMDALRHMFSMSAYDREGHIRRWRALAFRILTAGRQRQTCPRRMTEWAAWHRERNMDWWRRVGRDRVCSFCGSWNPTEFLIFCDDVFQTNAVELRAYLSDRRHKVYCHRPGVDNASEGAIKFYLAHLSRRTEAHTRLINYALQVSREALELEIEYSTIRQKISRKVDK